MKKILLTLLVLFGLQIQTQAQLSSFNCDSLEVTIVSSTPTEVILGTNIPSLAPSAQLQYMWMVYEHIITPPPNYSHDDTLVSWGVKSGGVDTITSLNQSSIYTITIFLNDTGVWVLPNACIATDTLTFDTVTNQWVGPSVSSNGNPTAITEIKINNVDDDRLYDLLGREFANYNSIPPNTVYIKNRKKYLKTR